MLEMYSAFLIFSLSLVLNVCFCYSCVYNLSEILSMTSWSTWLYNVLYK